MTSTRQAFKAGYMLACVNLATAHGEDAYAAMLLEEAGYTAADLAGLDLSADDLKVLRTALRENARRTAAG